MPEREVAGPRRVPRRSSSARRLSHHLTSVRNSTLSSKEAAQAARVAAMKAKPLHSYQMDDIWATLTAFRGTIWARVFRRFEVWAFPSVHAALVASYQLQLSETPQFTLAWHAVGIGSGLMTFLLVFFCNQCYVRFNDLYRACMAANGALHELALHMLASVRGNPTCDGQDRWHACRFAVAATIITFFRVRDLARGKAPVLNDDKWSRLECFEQDWLGVSGKEWMTIQGYSAQQIHMRSQLGAVSQKKAPFKDKLISRLSGTSIRSAVSQAASGNWTNAQHTAAFNPSLCTYPSSTHTQDQQAKFELLQKRLQSVSYRSKSLTTCPPLLTEWEIDLLELLYPQSEIMLVLIAWSMQSIRARLDGPAYTAAQATLLRLREANAEIVNDLAMPLPFPYWHALQWVMVLNFSMYTIALVELDSWLTIPSLFVTIAMTVGLREISADLSNPFGDDEVDFNIEALMFKMRGTVSRVVYDGNSPAVHPGDPKKKQSIFAVIRAKDIIRKAIKLSRARRQGSIQAMGERGKCDKCDTTADMGARGAHITSTQLSVAANIMHSRNRVSFSPD